MSSVICPVVDHRRTSQKIWGDFLYGVYSTCLKKTELIPTVEIEIRNPLDDYFGSEFPAICDHCEVMGV